MNIFKILQGGHGSISETNVTAFLSYLLNPKKDHGLNDELLKRLLSVLKQNKYISESILVDRKNNIRNLSINSTFEIEVIPEQAFYLEIDEEEIVDNKRNHSRKKIIDIVILCFKKKDQKVQNLATAILSNNQRGELTQIFFIENKINDNSTTQDQLNKEIKHIIGTLKDMKKTEEEIKKIISLIFITPLGQNSSKEFEEFKNTGIDFSTGHLHWNSKDENEKTISRLLKDILNDEANGKIEAINEYTKYSLKSFINFIENGFKSDIIEDLEHEMKRETFETLDELKDAYPELVDKNSWDILIKFDNQLRKKYLEISTQYSPHHPIAVFKGSGKYGTKIFSFTKGNAQKLVLHLILRNFEMAKVDKEAMKKLLENYNFVVKDEQNYALKATPKSLNLKNAINIFDKQYQIFDKTNFKKLGK